MARNKHPEETVNLIVDTALELFISKGYEKTSIQDIINNLGGLSKGAIYHHFKSKEEIFEAVGKKIGDMNMVFYDSVLDDTSKNGFEKLRYLLQSACSNPTNEAILAMKTKIVSEPKFVVNQIKDIYEFIVPRYLEPIIKEGMEDGSIQTEFPRELGEVILTLLNVWLSPLVSQSTQGDMERKVCFLKEILDGIHVPILDEALMIQIIDYCGSFCEE